jgi:hypothetical protein
MVVLGMGWLILALRGFGVRFMLEDLWRTKYILDGIT